MNAWKTPCEPWGNWPADNYRQSRLPSTLSTPRANANAAKTGLVRRRRGTRPLDVQRRYAARSLPTKAGHAVGWPLPDA